MAAHGTDFRPDIEGLRAWAIVPVVVFHAFPHCLPGGFLGVDVFFVISGYLITKLLAQRMDAGTYSLAGFCAARVKRIFSVLFVALLPAALSERVRRGGSVDDQGQPLADYQASHADELRLLHRLASRPGVELLEVSAALCAAGRCAVADADGAYYFDKHHLSLRGARHLAGPWAARLLP